MKAALLRTALRSVGALCILTSPCFGQKLDFNRDVLPILSSHCLACHGHDAAKRKADLRLDERASALAERAKAPAIVPGNPSASELIVRVLAEDAEGRMPPPKAGARLKPNQVQILRSWIEQGATYTDHWAFQSISRPEIPRVSDPAWPRNPVDCFLLQRLEKNNLRPAGGASRETLIRRATIDLLGLPPSAEEVAAFVADKSPLAYPRLIERLLASPHYGERWGRHWLDVARYADSGGFETDIFYANAWRYRDYVIRAFNADKPFDQFIREQLAGDELYPDDRTARLATAMYTIGPVLEEAGMVEGKLDDDWLTDAVDTTGSVFLGLNLGCARCHDHKYDPISQRDYYGIQAIFAASNLVDFSSDGKVLRSEKVALRKTEKEFEQARLKTMREKQPGEYDEYAELPLRGLGHRASPLKVRLLMRGELNSPKDVVEPGLPETFSLTQAFDRSDPRTFRSQLAEWIASRRNPLTARVIVNRIWQGHFGYGLVRTPNDLGVRGERPTHPELLDWLAVEFMENGWSFKHLHRLIMLSNAYQMASATDNHTMRVDPANQYLARYPSPRVEAEVIWDSMRKVAGTLDSKMFGLPIGPPLDQRELIGNYRRWHASPPGEANRRAVYIVVRRSYRFPALSAFDLPENVSSCGQRDNTIVPNQALTLLNNRMVREQARAFAGRLLRETNGRFEAIAAQAWRHAYGRTISDDEQQQVVRFLLDQLKTAASGETSAREKAVVELCVALFNTSESIYLP